MYYWRTWMFKENFGGSCLDEISILENFSCEPFCTKLITCFQTSTFLVNTWETVALLLCHITSFFRNTGTYKISVFFSICSVCTGILCNADLATVLSLLILAHASLQSESENYTALFVIILKFKEAEVTVFVHNFLSGSHILSQAIIYSIVHFCCDYTDRYPSIGIC